MSAKQDIQQGLRAELSTSRDAVVAACERAVATLGEHARCHHTPAQLTVEILPCTSGELVRVSPVVGVSVAPTADGRVSVRTSVDRYVTLQSRKFGLVHTGPKHLLGRRYYFDFLGAFEHELLALDPSAAAVQRSALAG